VLVIVCIIFSVWKPAEFPHVATLQSILNSNATVALLALSLVIPLAAGVFDLSIGAIMALTGVLAAQLVVGQGFSVGVALLIGLLLGVVLGAFNALIVVGLGIESFIGTLGTSSIMTAVILLICNDESVTNEYLSSTLQRLATISLGGIQLPVFIVAAVAVVMWYFMEHTVSGRRLYAIGFNIEAARLSGISTKRLRSGALLVSGFISGLAGLILMAQTGSGAPTAGPEYLLSAFAAAFLGATQIRNGRFNTVGTLLAVLVLGTGTAGLTIAGAATWALNLFVGIVLLVALALTKLKVQGAASSSRRRQQSGGVLARRLTAKP
jgi:ribose transport system permease protein